MFIGLANFIASRHPECDRTLAKLGFALDVITGLAVASIGIAALFGHLPISLPGARIMSAIGGGYLCGVIGLAYQLGMLKLFCNELPCNHNNGTSYGRSAFVQIRDI